MRQALGILIIIYCSLLINCSNKSRSNADDDGISNSEIPKSSNEKKNKDKDLDKDKDEDKETKAETNQTIQIDSGTTTDYDASDLFGENTTDSGILYEDASNYSGNGGELFFEGWELSSLESFSLSEVSFIQGDEGYWYLGDTVSGAPECGPVPHQAEIIIHEGSNALRITSGLSVVGGCADNIWVYLIDTSTYGSLDYNKGFSIPLRSPTYISFMEEGELIEPGPHGQGSNCVMPPCFHNISLLITDNHQNALVYVLQRHPDILPNEDESNYKEIFLDPSSLTYERNLFDDFNTIPSFDMNGAQIVSIEFRVDQHGWAVIDDISIEC